MSLSLIIILQNLLVPLKAFLEDYNQYYSQGDMIIGVLAPLGFRCKNSQEFANRFITVIAVDEIVKEINEDPQYIFKEKNWKLGYFLMDTCYSSKRVIGFMKYFGPQDTPIKYSCSVLNIGEFPCLNKQTYLFELQFYSINGMIGPSYSEIAIIVSKYLQNFHIPQITPHSTTNELTNKTNHPFLLRLVASDRYQADTIFDIVKYLNITRIIIIYYSNEYGENLVNYLRYKFLFNGVCIFLEIDLKNKMLEFYMTQLFELNAYVNHILYIARWDYQLLKRLHPNQFIFICADSAYNVPKKYSNVTLNSIFISLGEGSNSRYSQIYNNLTREMALNYPYGKEFWENEHKCCFGKQFDVSGKPCNISCDKFNNITKPKQDYSTGSIYADAMKIFAKAFTQYAKDNETIFNSLNRSEIRKSITGLTFMKYLKNVKFNGSSVNVNFNEFGDTDPNYLIAQQIDLHHLKTIGHWDFKLKMIESAFDPHTLRYATKKHCAAKCPKLHVKKLLKVFWINACCFKCIKCNSNEVPSKDQRRCEVCPKYHWPDEPTEKCNVIPLTSLDLTHTWEGKVCLSLSLIGIVIVIAVSIIHMLYYNSPILKAASIHLSCLCLCGLLLVFLTIFIPFIGQVSLFRCRFQTIAMHASIDLVYSSMLVKTARINRLFRQSSAGKKNVRFTSIRFVIVATLLCFVFDLALLTSLQLLAGEEDFAAQLQPDLTIKYVEYTCRLTDIWRLWLPLGWHAVKNTVCCIMALQVRSLPDSFHDSRYILTSSAASLCLWILFLPVILAAPSLFLQILLLCAILFLCAVIITGFLFIPKIYALLWTNKIDSPPSQISNISTVNNISTTNFPNKKH